ncbi:MAG: sensor histidine kinase [Streptosporangiaceae bacterium]|nr:sensor histidine kinase [Streptosporangiaceae bacterium]MBV9855061.1 sensor histidine kinase [Streptosporangiaceae bacterium]
MRTAGPQTALQATAWPRLLASSWPWRSAGYLLTTMPVALAAFTGLAIVSLPWLELGARLAAGNYQAGAIAALILLGAALVGLAGPAAAVPLAELERRRLRVVDAHPVASGHRHPPATGARAWLATRYTEPATWRETCYACLLATVAPVLSIAALSAVPLAAMLIASPFLVLAQQPGSAPVALPLGTAATAGQAVPYAIAGIVLLLLVPHLLTLAAGAHGAVARALLEGGPAERLRAELADVSRSRARLADAFEAERRRIERDLHDGAQQKLVSLTMQLGLARLDTPPGSPAATAVTAAHEQAKQLMADLRELIHGIRPQVLADLGLPAALRELADQCPVPVTVTTGLAGRFPGQVEYTAYFVVAEALTNVVKHSGATRASVTAFRDSGALAIEVSDNGRGGASPGRGTGLTGLADRIAVTGGRMLLSSPPGGPTLVRAELPCQGQP